MRRRGRSRGQRALRLFFASDVHGSDRCFRKFLAAAEAYEANVLVLGGDLAAKGLIPIRSEDGNVRAEVHGETVVLPASDEPRLVADINRIGLYGVRMDEDEIVALRDEPARVEAALRRQVSAQMRRWCELAAERLPDHVRCIITPGNDDPPEVDEALRAAARVEAPEKQLCDLGPVVLASLGDVTPTPWNTHRECTEEELATSIESMLDAAPSDRPTIVNFHCPPYGSGLDLAPELDDTLRHVIRGGRPSFVPVGSKAVRDAIRRYRPAVGLHGHIHESRAAQKIGDTLCLNPGSDYTGDLLRGVIVDIALDGSCLDFLFTAG